MAKRKPHRPEQEPQSFPAGACVTCYLNGLYHIPPDGLFHIRAVATGAPDGGSKAYPLCARCVGWWSGGGWNVTRAGDPVTRLDLDAALARLWGGEPLPVEPSGDAVRRAAAERTWREIERRTDEDDGEGWKRGGR